MSIVDEDKQRWLDHKEDPNVYPTAGDRLALYFQVVKALVPGHDITDDDPERTVVEALYKIENLTDHATMHGGGTAWIDANDRTRELVKEIDK